MDVMLELAALARQAAAGDPRGAAHSLVASCENPAIIERLIRMALWEGAMIEDFERQGQPTLIKGCWGRFWLAPVYPARSLSLRPPAPILTPRALKALGRGVVDILAA